MGLGQFATVVELRIPCVYAWGVSNDYLKEQKFLVLLEKAAMLRKEIGILKEAEMACQKKQEELQEQVDSLEKELETYKK